MIAEPRDASSLAGEIRRLRDQQERLRRLHDKASGLQHRSDQLLRHSVDLCGRSESVRWDSQHQMSLVRQMREEIERLKRATADD
jgi:hypothetical protein